MIEAAGQVDGRALVRASDLVLQLWPAASFYTYRTSRCALKIYIPPSYPCVLELSGSLRKSNPVTCAWPAWCSCAGWRWLPAIVPRSAPLPPWPVQSPSPAAHKKGKHSRGSASPRARRSSELSCPSYPEVVAPALLHVGLGECTLLAWQAQGREIHLPIHHHTITTRRPADHQIRGARAAAKDTFRE